MAQTSPRRLGPRGLDDVLYPKLGTEIRCPRMWPVPVGCVGINQMKPIDFNPDPQSRSLEPKELADKQ